MNKLSKKHKPDQHWKQIVVNETPFHFSIHIFHQKCDAYMLIDTRVRGFEFKLMRNVHNREMKHLKTNQ